MKKEAICMFFTLSAVSIAGAATYLGIRHTKRFEEIRTLVDIQQLAKKDKIRVESNKHFEKYNLKEYSKKLRADGSMMALTPTNKKECVESYKYLLRIHRNLFRNCYSDNERIYKILGDIHNDFFAFSKTMRYCQEQYPVRKETLKNIADTHIPFSDAQKIEYQEMKRFKAANSYFYEKTLLEFRKSLKKIVDLTSFYEIEEDEVLQSEEVQDFIYNELLGMYYSLLQENYARKSVSCS